MHLRYRQKLKYEMIFKYLNSLTPAEHNPQSQELLSKVLKAINIPEEEEHHQPVLELESNIYEMVIKGKSSKRVSFKVDKGQQSGSQSLRSSRASNKSSQSSASKAQSVSHKPKVNPNSGLGESEVGQIKETKPKGPTTTAMQRGIDNLQSEIFSMFKIKDQPQPSMAEPTLRSQSNLTGQYNPMQQTMSRNGAQSQGYGGTVDNNSFGNALPLQSQVTQQSGFEAHSSFVNQRNQQQMGSSQNINPPRTIRQDHVGRMNNNPQQKAHSYFQESRISGQKGSNSREQSILRRKSNLQGYHNKGPSFDRNYNQHQDQHHTHNYQIRTGERNLSNRQLGREREKGQYQPQSNQASRSNYTSIKASPSLQRSRSAVTVGSKSSPQNCNLHQNKQQYPNHKMQVNPEQIRTTIQSKQYYNRSDLSRSSSCVISKQQRQYEQLRPMMIRSSVLSRQQNNLMVQIFKQKLQTYQHK